MKQFFALVFLIFTIKSVGQSDLKGKYLGIKQHVFIEVNMMMFNSIEDVISSEPLNGRNVLYSKSKYDPITNLDSLIGHEFIVDSVITLTAENVYNPGKYWLKCFDLKRNRTVIIKHGIPSTKYPFYIHSKANLPISPCSDLLETELDEFEDYKKYTINFTTYGVMKTTKKGYTYPYVLRLSMNDNEDDPKGLWIIFNDGSKLSKPDFDIMSIKKVAGNYSVFISLTHQEMLNISKKIITKYRIGTIANEISIDSANRIKDAAMCVVSKS